MNDSMHAKGAAFTVQGPFTTNGECLNLLQLPDEKWEWAIFGDPSILAIRLRSNVSWWQRVSTTIFFGSKWRKLS